MRKCSVSIVSSCTLCGVTDGFVGLATVHRVAAGASRRYNLATPGVATSVVGASGDAISILINSGSPSGDNACIGLTNDSRVCLISNKVSRSLDFGTLSLTGARTLRTVRLPSKRSSCVSGSMMTAFSAVAMDNGGFSGGIMVRPGDSRALSGVRPFILATPVGQCTRGCSITLTLFGAAVDIANTCSLSMGPRAVGTLKLSSPSIRIAKGFNRIACACGFGGRRSKDCTM